MLRKTERVKPNMFESRFVKVEGKEQTKDEKVAAEAIELGQLVCSSKQPHARLPVNLLITIDHLQQTKPSLTALS